VDGFADRRFTLAAEDPLLHQVRHRGVQPVNVAHPAAQHNHVRIENIHHVRQRFRQPHFIAAQGQLRHRILLFDQTHDLVALERLAAQAVVIGRKTGAGDKGLNTALLCRSSTALQRGI
jgi:hypothetical protein